MINISLFFFFFVISFAFTFLRMGLYFEKIFKLFTHFYKILQKLQRLVIPIHPLERLFIFLSTIYIMVSISLIPKTLGEQINGYMCVSDWLFYLIIPGLIMGSII